VADGVNVNKKEKIERQDDQPGNRTTMELKTDSGAEERSAVGSSTQAKQGMSSELQAHIGRHLRAAFDEIAREPVPDRFLQLLKDLEKGEQPK